MGRSSREQVVNWARLCEPDSFQTSSAKRLTRSWQASTDVLGKVSRRCRQAASVLWSGRFASATMPGRAERMCRDLTGRPRVLTETQAEPVLRARPRLQALHIIAEHVSVFLAAKSLPCDEATHHAIPQQVRETQTRPGITKQCTAPRQLSKTHQGPSIRTKSPPQQRFTEELASGRDSCS